MQSTGFWQQLNQIDVSHIDTNGFYLLIDYISNVRDQTDPANKQIFKRANELLTEFSKTTQAWTVCFEVLIAQGTESQHFQAASILKNKMMYDYAALKQYHGDQVQLCQEMRVKMIQVISNLSQPQNLAPRFILNTLSTALAYFTIHTHQTWQNAIEDMAQILSGSVDQALCLLNTLKYMANECDNNSIVIEESIRKSFYLFLNEKSLNCVLYNILNLWATKLLFDPQTNQDGVLKREIMSTFYAWIRLKLPKEIFLSLSSGCLQLLQMTLGELASKDEQNVEKAADCTVELLEISRILGTDAIQTFVLSSLPFIKQQVSQAFLEQDVEAAQQFDRIFVQLALNNMSQIVDQGQTEIVYILLSMMQQMPEMPCRAQILFWEDLFTQIKGERVKQFQDIILQLLNCLCQKSTMNQEQFLLLNELSNREEDFDGLTELRTDVGRLLRKLIRCCGSDILEYVKQRIGNCFQKVLTAQTDDEKLKAWIDVEGNLFVVQELAKKISSDNLSMLLDVVTLILQMPTQYTALRLQATEFVISISPLIQINKDNHGLLKPLLMYTLQGFNDKKLTLNSSAYCFRYLCRDNSKLIAPFTQELIEQILVPQFVETWTFSECYTDIMSGFGHLIPVVCQLNSKICEQLIKATIQPLLIPVNQKIQQITQIKMTGEGKLQNRIFVEISDSLQLIGDFLKNCNELQEKTQENQINPLAPVFQELWPFLENVMRQFMYNDDVIEFSCRLVKHSQRALGNQFLQYLIPFLTLTIAGYQQNQIGSYVYALEFCFQEFGHQPQHADIFIQAFDFIVDVSYAKIVTKDQCEQNPDLINDIFGMASRFIQNGKSLFFRSNKIENFIEFTLRCIGLGRFRAVKTHSEFLNKLINFLKEDLRDIQPDAELQGTLKCEQLVWKFLLQQGQKMTLAYVNAILNVPTEDVAQFFTEVLVNLIAAFRDNSWMWLQNCLQTVPLNVLTDENKQQMVQNVQGEFRRSSLLHDLDTLAERARGSATRQK